jgi:hypothetical protein
LTATPSREAVGERRHLTVLFCDLVGSTAIAARLDPERWREPSPDFIAPPPSPDRAASSVEKAISLAHRQTNPSPWPLQMRSGRPEFMVGVGILDARRRLVTKP